MAFAQHDKLKNTVDAISATALLGGLTLLLGSYALYGGVHWEANDTYRQLLHAQTEWLNATLGTQATDATTQAGNAFWFGVVAAGGFAGLWANRRNY